MTPVFTARTPFDSTDGPRWENYVRWAQIPRLIEVVGLDSTLCPSVISEYIAEDWKHNVQDNSGFGYFYNLDYLLGRVTNVSRKNIIGLYRNPDSRIEVAPAEGGFVFVGYDLIEEMTQISALTNCGGFPETFANEELNEVGLLPAFERANEVRMLLAKNNPDEPHAHCEMYAIWRLREA